MNNLIKNIISKNDKISINDIEQIIKEGGFRNIPSEKVLEMIAEYGEENDLKLPEAFFAKED